MARLQRSLLLGGQHRLQRHHRRVAAAGEAAVRIEHVGHAAAHARGEIPAGLSQHHDGAAGHVFAAVIAGALHHRGDARVAHAEALAGDAGEEGLAGDAAVEHGVADDDVLVGPAAEVGGGTDDDAAARQALADVVVAFAGEVQGDAAGEEGAEALAGGAGQRDHDAVVGQALVAVAAGDLVREHGTAAAIDVPDRRLDDHPFAAEDGRLRLRDQRVVESAGQSVVLLLAMMPDRLPVLDVEDPGEVQATGLPVIDGGALVEQVGAADQIVEAADAHRRHQLAHFLGDEEEVIDHVLGLAGEFLAQRRILGGHAHRAGVEVALPHHDAARDHQRRGGETELVGAEQRADQHVPAGLQLAVDLDADASAQPVQDQGLLGLGQTQFPRRAGVLDRGDRRGAGAAVVAGDHHVVGLGLGDAGGDGTHADFGDQLDRDRGPGVGVLQVVDQLRQVLDRIDVVVRRRRDQADAGHRMAQLPDVLGDLVSGQLAALAGLGALGHLDLDLLGAGEILCGDAEAPRGDLLDLGAQRVAGLQFQVALDPPGADDLGELLAALQHPVAVGVLAALAGVRLAADAVHGDGQQGVRLGRDRAQRHGAGGEALDDFAGLLDLRDRHRRTRRLELEQAAQGQLPAALVVDEGSVLLVGRGIAGPGGVLQLGDRVRRPRMLLAADPVGIFAAGIEHGGEHRVGAEGLPVTTDRLLRDLEHADALDAAGGAGEILIDEAALQADRLENLRPGVGHVGGDAHLRHHLAQALAHRLGEVLDVLLGFLGIAVGEIGERVQRQVGMHGFRAVAAQQRKVMHLARRAGLDHQTGAGAQALLDQVLMHRRGGEQRRDRHVIGIDAPIRDDQDVVPGTHRVLGFGHQRGQPRLDAGAAPGLGVGDVDFAGAELAAGEALDVADLGHVAVGEHRLRHLQADRRIDVRHPEEIGLRPDEGGQRGDDLLADRIDRRIGHLREELLEVVVEGLVPGGEHRQRRIVAHRAQRFLAALRHRPEDELDVLLRVAEGLLAVEQRRRRIGHRRAVAIDLVQLDADLLDPFAVGLGVGQRVLELLVVDDPPLDQVDQEHLARLQAPLLDDPRLRHRQHAGFRRHDHHVVVGHQEARRAQAVPVERGADLAAVGEGHRGRTVPGFHHRRVVFVEGAAVLVHRRVLLPGLRNHQHHRVGQRVAAHHQEFQGVVEGGGVRLAVVDQRPDLGQIGAQHRRTNALLARPDPIDVAAQGVDLAVVGDEAEGMRQVPGREGVGRETLVHQRQRRDDAGVLQVAVVVADLVGEQQALVDQRARRERGHVEFLAVLQAQPLDGVAGALPDDVELALQSVGDQDIGAAADEDLPDHRLDLLDRFAQHRVVHRHVAPAEQDLALGPHRALDLLLAGHARSALLRQEDHADAVLALGRQGHALPGHFLAEEAIGNLEQEAGAVARLGVGADRAAMGQILENLQTLQHDLVALLILDVGDEADAAGVVFVGGVVQTLALG